MSTVDSREHSAPSVSVETLPATLERGAHERIKKMIGAVREIIRAVHKGIKKHPKKIALAAVVISIPLGVGEAVHEVVYHGSRLVDGGRESTDRKKPSFILKEPLPELPGWQIEIRAVGGWTKDPLSGITIALRCIERDQNKSNTQSIPFGRISSRTVNPYENIFMEIPVSAEEIAKRRAAPPGKKILSMPQIVSALEEAKENQGRLPTSELIIESAFSHWLTGYEKKNREQDMKNQQTSFSPSY